MTDKKIYLAPQTIQQLEAQRQRRQAARSSGDAHGAAMAMLVVDEILDLRPRPIAVTDDGEALWPGTSPWVTDEAAPREPAMRSGVAPSSGGLLESPFTAEELAKLKLQARTELGMIPGRGPRA